MEFRTVHIGSIDYVSGQKKTLDIPREGVALQYNLRLRYTNTNSATPPVSPKFEALARLLNRVDVNIGGRDTVVAQPGEMLAARAQYEHGTQADGMGDTVVLTGSAATAYDVSLPIPRFLPRSQTPLLCGDALPLVSQATMEIDWGTDDGADLFVTPNAPAISAVTLDVEVEYLLGLSEDQMRNFRVRELFTIREDYTAANAEFGITVDGRTGRVVRSVAVAATDGLVGNNSLVNSMRVESGSFKWHDNKAAALQARNKIEFQQENAITGFYYRPLTNLGDTSLSIDTGGLPADLKAVFDLSTGSSTEQLLMSVEGIRPLIRS